MTSVYLSCITQSTINALFTVSEVKVNISKAEHFIPNWINGVTPLVKLRQIRKKKYTLTLLRVKRVLITCIKKYI